MQSRACDTRRRCLRFRRSPSLLPSREEARVPADLLFHSRDAASAPDGNLQGTATTLSPATRVTDFNRVSPQVKEGRMGQKESVEATKTSSGPVHARRVKSLLMPKGRRSMYSGSGSAIHAQHKSDDEGRTRQSSPKPPASPSARGHRSPAGHATSADKVPSDATRAAPVVSHRAPRATPAGAAGAESRFRERYFIIKEIR